MAEARRVIQDDAKSAREAVFSWITAIGAAVAMLTGLVGALTGLAALLLKVQPAR